MDSTGVPIGNGGGREDDSAPTPSPSVGVRLEVAILAADPSAQT